MSNYISDFDKISGSDFYVNGFILIRQPLLKDIRAIGYDTFLKYVSIIIYDPREDEKTKAECLDLINQYGLFQLMTFNEESRKSLESALRFFVVQDIVYSKDRLCYNVFGKDGNIVGEINEETFPCIQDAVMEILDIPTKPRVEHLTFQNEYIKEAYLKGQREKAKFQKAKARENGEDEKNFVLSNIISAVAAKHPSYNLLNIWGLTILQLHDQFYRLRVGGQENVDGMRWAVWGSKPINFNNWFKILK